MIDQGGSQRPGHVPGRTGAEGRGRGLRCRRSRPTTLAGAGAEGGRAAGQDEAEGQALAGRARCDAAGEGGPCAPPRRSSPPREARDEALARIRTRARVVAGRHGRGRRRRAQPPGEPPSLAEPREHTEVGRFDMERAARLSGSRFGYLIGDTALLACPLPRRARPPRPARPRPCCRRARARGGDDGPASSDERSNIYGLADDDLYLTGPRRPRRRPAHRRTIPAGAAAPLRGLLDDFSPQAGAAGKDTRGCSASTNSTRSRFRLTRRGIVERARRG